MYIFFLDKLLITFIKGLIADPLKQFSVLTGLWVVSEIVFPSKKVKK